MTDSEHPTPRLPGATEPDTEPDTDPETQLDPEVDARVRALLAAPSDSGPMPADVAARIELALADEARLRVARGPLPAAGGEPVADMAGRGEGVVRLPVRRRPRPWVAAAAVAAAAAVVAVGVSALHVTQRPNPAAVVVGDTSTVGPTATSPAPATSAAPATTPHIQLSTTDYTAATLAAQARALLDDPATPLADLAAESPSLGPIATPVGLASCLEALGALGAGAVTADLATFGGRPAAIIVVTDAGTSTNTAYAVERNCSPGNVTTLAGPTPVP
ncbi:hypothetical protein [Humibacillus xanthopallidus]|uniref:hypothetical protein n=1 Tax=Humibacillus xanthopallidus TaxID=412689 RepID=UPI0038501DDF